MYSIALDNFPNAPTPGATRLYFIIFARRGISAALIVRCEYDFVCVCVCEPGKQVGLPKVVTLTGHGERLGYARGPM